MPNKLIDERSPYLLQHAHNPVQWYPWSEAAFNKAREENKPLFLSIGYATCHWCHVMEKESFEDAEAAAVLNDSFVCIKVDREERPDIDAVYMAACQMITGSGGWPLSIVMTPDKQPFFAATYLPKNNMLGRIGLVELCRRISRVWQNEPQRVLESAQAVTGHLSTFFEYESGNDPNRIMTVVQEAVNAVVQRYDADFGGFDTAPKFPMAHRIDFLLNAHQRTPDRQLPEQLVHTLTAMRYGGLWDHVGFGFHRYSTDRKWLLPHFEKMLYDQALLASAYLNVFKVSEIPLFAQTARDIFAYVLESMTDPAGAFYTAEDADSDGEEGKFYVWSYTEFEGLLDESQKDVPWSKIFNLNREGNFHDEATGRKTGANILHLSRSWRDWSDTLQISEQTLKDRWHALRCKLFEVRNKRIAPLKDDKILVDWNGMMIAALAEGAQTLSEKMYLTAAKKAAAFILEHMTTARGGLLHRHRQGQTAIAATANDYAYLIKGLMALYRADQNQHWLEQAARLQHAMQVGFWDSDKGGFFLTTAEHHDLPVRPKEIYDGATPSANAVALHNLIDLFQATGERVWHGQAWRLIQAFAGSVRRQPTAYVHMLDGWAKYSQIGMDSHV